MERKPDRPLRRGWTTGACATAATRAAYTALKTGAFPDPVTITLPGGQRPAFALAREEQGADYALAGIIKDAGDDPDVTHLAEIIARVEPGAPGSGLRFAAGPGVGMVTRPGLPLPVGEPAINPVPRRMMRQTLAEAAEQTADPGDLMIEISVPGGEALAERTWNPRLGIVGGLSILGTTGIVVPYSCSAWIHSIHRGIDVARAANLTHVAACTGSTSERRVRDLYDLPNHAMLDMGDFAGGLLKYLRKHPLPKLTIGGGFAKISKLALGHLDLHSGRSQVDLDWLADQVGALGGGAALVAACRTANTASEVLSLSDGLPLGDLVADQARATAMNVLQGSVPVEVLVFDRDGNLVGRSDG